MEEMKKTFGVVVEPVVWIKCLCPHCGKEKRILWDIESSSRLEYCGGCEKSFEVIREDK